jgi:hypothetical protein
LACYGMYGNHEVAKTFLQMADRPNTQAPWCT